MTRIRRRRRVASLQASRHARRVVGWLHPRRRRRVVVWRVAVAIRRRRLVRMRLRRVSNADAQASPWLAITGINLKSIGGIRSVFAMTGAAGVVASGGWNYSGNYRGVRDEPPHDTASGYRKRAAA